MVCVYGTLLDIAIIREGEFSEWIVDLFLQNGTCIDIQDNAGKTLLHRVAKRQNYQAYEFLLSRGADPDLPDKEGCTPKELLEK
jgi:ankyrin repeat protein